MSWTAPPTFVAGAVFTAAQANILGGDIAFLGGTTGATVATSQTTTSTTYADLGTIGPVVTVTTGANALVICTSSMGNASSSNNFMGFAISGATTLAAADATALVIVCTGVAGAAQQNSALYFQTGLTAGSNTFTAKYRTTAGTCSFGNRCLTVIPLP